MVHINPQMVRWAREEAGLSDEELAKKIFGTESDKTSTLEGWETGTNWPTPAQLRKLAESLKRPPALFFYKEPPASRKRPMDFRGYQYKSELTYSSRLVIRKVENRREYALEIATALEEETEEFPSVRINQNPEKLSQQIRDWLGMNEKSVVKLKKSDELLRQAIRSIETKGVLVMQFEGVDLIEFRGFSIAEHPFPVIGINGTDAPSGKLFTLFHELGHILIGKSGICDFEVGEESRRPNDKIEIWCNHFAAATLLPEGEFRQRLDELRFKSDASLINIISELKNFFPVSREAIARRLLSIRKISQRSYLDLRDQFQQEWVEYRDKQKESKGFAPPKYRTLNQTGRRYANLVIDAWHNNKLTALEASDLLGIRIKQLENISHEIQRTGVSS